MRDDSGSGMNRRSLIVRGLAAGAGATLMSGAGKAQAADKPRARGAWSEAEFATSSWSMAPTPTGRAGLR